MKVGCYLRVSTDDQDEENQRLDLERLCAARGWIPVWFADHGRSGKTTERDAYQSMMAEARAGRIKAVVVWKFDRLGRTVRQLVTDLDDLNGWGCSLVSAHDAVDTTTTMGRAMFGIIAVFAQMERDQISDRTKAAYNAKKAKAASLGRKPVWGRRAEPVNPAAVAMARDGAKAYSIAKALGISRRQAEKAVESARNGEAPNAGSATPDDVGGTKSVDYEQGADA